MPDILQILVTGSAPTAQVFSAEIITGIIVLIILLIGSALMSGSEVAYFSLSPGDIDLLKKSRTNASQRILKLMRNPERMLATILVGNNFFNVGIVILSTFISSHLFHFTGSPVFTFLVQIVIVTFIILFFGEILPKVYATHYGTRLVSLMALPLTFFQLLFHPITYFLVKSTNIVNKRLARKGNNFSMGDLSHALDLTTSELKEDEKILKGIVRFGNIDVKEIMISRMDFIAVDMKEPFSSVLTAILESGYSRIPIFNGNLDHIKGILHIKDILPYAQKPDFKWQSLIRPAYFVPETKKINDLLEEFQSNKNHLAIVIDEYGGTSGIVTMEDILEEIVGEINDEFDVADENNYVKISDNSFIFEGKTQLNDFCKITGFTIGGFDDIRGDADSLAGLLLEIKGDIPEKNEIINYRNFSFKIKSADNRRIKQIIVTINPTETES